MSTISEAKRGELELELRSVTGMISAERATRSASYDEAERLERSGGDAAKVALFRGEAEKAASSERRLRQRADELMSQLGNLGSTAGDEITGETVALTNRQRVADWARLHGVDSGFAGEKLSFGKYLKGIVTGDWEGAGLERRAMTEGTLADGGYLVPTPLSPMLIDRARDAARVLQVGAMTVPMDSHTLAIARVAQADGDTTSYWKTKGAAITESAMTFERVTLTAKSLTALVKASIELFQDAANIEQVLTDNLGKVLGLEIDLAALYGTGVDPEPLGVANTSGILAKDVGVNGAALACLATYIDALEQLWDANENPNAIIQAPRTELAIARAPPTRSASRCGCRTWSPGSPASRRTRCRLTRRTAPRTTRPTSSWPTGASS